MKLLKSFLLTIINFKNDNFSKDKYDLEDKIITYSRRNQW